MTSRSIRSPEARRASRTLLLGVGTALLSALSPSEAGAEVPLDLLWVAPTGCPQAADVREHIRVIAGDALRGMSRLRAEGRVTRVEGRYRLTLTVYEGSSPRDRTIDSASCADLAGAAAVTLGLLLRGTDESPAERERAAEVRAGADSPPSADAAAGPSAGAQPTSASASAPGSSQSGTTTGANRPPTSDASDARSSDDSEPGARRTWRLFVQAPLGAFEVGRLPAPSWGVGVALGLRYARWRFGVGGRIFREQSSWSNEFSDFGVAVAPVSLASSVCRGFGGARVEVGPCLWLGLERLKLRGFGPDVAARSHTLTSFELGAGAAVQLHVSEWFSLIGGAELGLYGARPRVVIGGIGEVRQLGAVKLGLTLGSEWIF